MRSHKAGSIAPLQMPRRLGRNFLLVLLINVSARLANVLLFVAIARRLGAESAGSFNLALTYTAIFFTLSLWGLDELLIRDVAQNRQMASRFLLHFGVVRFALASGAYVVLLLLLRWVVPYALHTRWVIALIGTTVVADGMNALGRSVFIAYEEFLLPTFVALLEGCVKVIGGIVALQLTSDTVIVGLAFVAGSWISVGIYYLGLIRLLHTHLLDIRWSPHFLVQRFHQVPHFAWIGIVYVLMFQADTILLSFLRGERAVGWYGVSQTIFTMALVLTRSYQTALYPVMSRLYAEEGMQGRRLQALYTASLLFSLFVGFPVAIIITGLSAEITTAFLGQPVVPAIGALKWTAWAVLAQLLIVPNVRILLASGHQQLVAWLLTASMSINLLLNFVFIPLWGIPGAGSARFLSLFFFFLLTSLGIHHYASHRVSRQATVVTSRVALNGQRAWSSQSSRFLQGLLSVLRNARREK